METTALADDHVVALVRGGRRDLFEVLMRRHNQRVYRTVRSYLTDEAEIEDVMQQAYLHAFVRLDQLAEPGKISSWLVRIAANEALSRVRKRRRLAEDDFDEALEDTTPMTARSSPEDTLSDRELAALLEAVLGDVPEIYRVVFVLREAEGMSTAEVAEALEVSEQVVKTRLFRAKELLRRRLLDRTGRAAGDVFTFQAPRCDRVVAAVIARLEALQTGD